jgi:hypothetical protein
MEEDIIHVDDYLEIQGSVGLETGYTSLGCLVVNKEY